MFKRSGIKMIILTAIILYTILWSYISDYEKQ